MNSSETLLSVEVAVASPAESPFASLFSTTARPSSATVRDLHVEPGQLEQAARELARLGFRVVAVSRLSVSVECSPSLFTETFGTELAEWNVEPVGLARARPSATTRPRGRGHEASGLPRPHLPPSGDPPRQRPHPDRSQATSLANNVSTRPGTETADWASDGPPTPILRQLNRPGVFGSLDVLGSAESRRWVYDPLPREDRQPVSRLTSTREDRRQGMYHAPRASPCLPVGTS